MPLEFSATVVGIHKMPSAGFSAASLEFSGCADFANPVLHIDHFRMSDVTFAPHPHAGFSAISYIFDDSPGSLRNRDSLGNDFVVGPGGMVWTQAGRGVVHEELPDVNGRTVHGLQIFVNLAAANKGRAPEVFRLSAEECPVVDDNGQTRVKIVSGSRGRQASPLATAEQLDLLDVSMGADWRLPLGRNSHTVFYVWQGAVNMDDGAGERKVGAYQAVAVRGEGVLHLVRAEAQTRIVVLSGPALEEPIAKYGPFVMNSGEELRAAMTRYQHGGMGFLAPLGSPHEEP